MSQKRALQKANNAPPTSLPNDEGMAVLSESEFTSRVDRIIERDFFPDLRRLQAQGKGLGLVDADDTVSENNAQYDSNIGEKEMSLDQFLAAHTSEDNASFGKLMESENAQRRHVYGRVVGDSSDRKLTALTGARDDSHTRKGLETWKYTARNALMFVPAAHETADDRRQVGRNGARILSHNTRLPEETEVTDDPSDWDAESVLSINSDATPTINGYKLIREPGTVKQGRNGVWRTRGFAIGETTPRERLARQLSTPTGNRKEAGKHEPSRSGKNSGSTAQKAAMLSPAALRLLRGTDEGDQAATPTQTRRDDHSLRKAYNSPYARRNPPTRHRRL